MTLDINKRVYNHRPGACRKVEGVQYGAEDIALLEDEGIAFVTSGVVYLVPRKKEVKGQIFIYDFNQKGTWKVKPVKINGNYDPENFHPHGISHIATDTGARLFVIVHSNEFEHSVMVFDWKRNTSELDLVRTIKDDKFIRPNDLAALSMDAFIITNDGYAQTRLGNLLEIISFYPSGSVVLYDGKASSHLISKSISPNGVILSKDRTYLILSHVNSETVTVYKLGKDHRSISHVSDVPLLTSPDNFCLDKDGAVWIGHMSAFQAAHPVAKDALVHLSDFDDPTTIAPSQVRDKYSVQIAKGAEAGVLERLQEVGDHGAITEPFADDGRFISASSIAAPYGNQLLIGSVCRQLVHCDVTPETV
ncbi:unnamed protein product [Heligmosomoides polygyrus]|uniref:SMP-30/Gluconolactonase/LRE-like region domain-containing protein n=1 Tax=Heligmosomoides polygyrus TaxID=6339 RepID=A0A3P8G905_HELPZ|nr:unnamed protein product [Heligmosomoides polygyrus]